MWDVDPEIVRVRVEALEWVSRADVARLWPATLDVTLVEKEPYALWQTKGVTWLIDRSGDQITKEDIAEFAGLPLVVGPGAPQHAVELIEIMNRFPAIQRRVKASVRVGDRRWDLHLKNGMQVRLPEDGVEDALNRLTVLEQEQKIFERDVESVDLRLPDRLVVKPRGGNAESVAKGEST
jgi:cell division protein FtsQ